MRQLRKEIANAGRATPQDFGLANEHVLLEALTEFYTEDRIARTGQAGDVVQDVRDNGKACGIIAYECKKKSAISPADVRDAIKAKRKTKADYAVLVHSGTRRGFSGFSIMEGVCVVSPSCVLAVSYLLRQVLVYMGRVDIDESIRQQVAQEVVRYIGSADFRSPLDQILHDARRESTELQRERNAHERWWKDREVRTARTLWNAGAIRACVEQAMQGIRPDPYTVFNQRKRALPRQRRVLALTGRRAGPKT
ncbi:MAG TPA: DUF2130 domain-containing protein [Candidatus Cybelea sp.]|nr:DUF2130 domain-containing protein [Candidatus Cybelea sp.]